LVREAIKSVPAKRATWKLNPVWRTPCGNAALIYSAAFLAARLICSASNSVRPKEKPGSDAGLEVMKNVYVMQVSSDNFSAYSNVL